MDPWVDLPDTWYNNRNRQVMDSLLIPFVDKMNKLKHDIFILTNDPKVVNYSTKVHPTLLKLSEEHENVEIIYHQQMDDDRFSKMLRVRGINTLIYCGYASNKCVIGRELGMVKMFWKGFQLYFVPKASAATEIGESWETSSIHEFTTDLISTNFGEIIDYDEIMLIKVQ